MKKKILLIISLIWALTAVLPAQFSGQTEAKPLITPLVNAGQGFIDFNFQVASGYHITDLKNNFFGIELEKNRSAIVEKVVFPPGIPFAEEKVFKGKFVVRVYIKTLGAILETITLKFNVSYQICQEFPQELCYPPEQSQILVSIGSDFRSPSGVKSGGNNETLSRRLEKLIRGQLSHSSFLLFILVFTAGFLASLTPCVYPVIPIIMGYVGSRSAGRKLKGFFLSLFFILGLSLVYSLLGVVSAKTGSLVGISFQNPLVVSIIAAIFIFMGLSLAGLFSIPVPAWISAKLGRSHKSDILGSLLVGGVSAIIAAPCVGPVLIALLSWISQSGNVILGFWLTMVFSLGMSVIFLIAGTFSGAISALPRGGHWMSAVKYFFAALLIAGGIYFLSNILSLWLVLLIWGIYFVTLAVALGLFKPQAETGIIHVLAKTLAALIFLLGAILFYQGLTGHFFPAGSAVPGVAKESLPWLNDLALAKEKARSENKRLMIDAWAEWCTACHELDEKTFGRNDVQENLRDYVLVKLDFTRTNASNKQLQKDLAIIGMPTIIFLDATGNEISRFSGFLGGSEFLKLLRDVK